MTLRLDPRWPLVWRDPFTLQIGIDPAIVVLADVTPFEEQVVAALSVGVPRRGLEVLTAADPARLDALLDRLRPALHDASPAPAARIAVTGSGALAEAVRAILVACGHELTTVDARDAPELAVIVGQWVLPPELHAYWLRRDVAHLPVVASDSAVQVGPVIEPGDGPCLLCLELHRRDGDVAWPAIATQLLGRSAGSGHPALVADVAATVARSVAHRVADGPGDAVSVRIDLGGARTPHEWTAHPECGCRGIAHLVAPAAGPATGRRGSGSPDAAIAPVLPPPTTVPGGAWPA